MLTSMKWGGVPFHSSPVDMMYYERNKYRSARYTVFKRTMVHMWARVGKYVK